MTLRVGGGGEGQSHGRGGGQESEKSGRIAPKNCKIMRSYDGVVERVTKKEEITSRSNGVY